jgi:hypothetical protein
MGGAGSGAHVGGGLLGERLDEARWEVKEGQLELIEVLQSVIQRLERANAGIALVEKAMGCTGLTTEVIRVEGISVRRPTRQAHLNDPGAVGRFIGAIADDAEKRVDARRAG